MDNETPDFTCPDCVGFGEYASGRKCSACRGTGVRECVGCHKADATTFENDQYLCEGCAILLAGCAYCVTGDPTCFHAERPCCDACLGTFAEAGRSDTVPCAAPNFEEVA